MLKNSMKKTMIWMLCLLMLFEPVIIPVLQAETSGPVINTEDIDGLVDLDEIVAPADYLEKMMALRGATKEEAEARVWGEWTMMLNSSFSLMDEGASEVFSFYEAMKLLRENSTVLADVADVVRTVSRFTTLGFSFLFRSRLLSQSTNMILGFMRLTNMTQAAQAWVDNNRVLDFMEFTAPPPFWHNPEVAGQGFRSYWRWVQRKAGNTEVTTDLTDSRGVARTLAIGLVIVGLAIDSWGIARSEDRMVGRTSYTLAKHYIGAALGVASLVAMFATPVIGQIVLIGGLLWGITTFAGDIVGAYNRRWKESYRNSFWYLYENDNEFRSYYENRSALKDEEKAASLRLMEKRFADFKVNQAEEGEGAGARNSRVYIALEKQGVLMSYYAKKGFSLPDFSMERLKELWQMKADFMSWKPSEAQAEEVRTGGFWARVGQTLDPVTWAGWIGDGIQSAEYRQTIEEYNLKKVFFNPDYVLVKKYINFTTAGKLMGGIYDPIGLRIEQSPFNYIPLLGIDVDKWSDEVLKEAFVADSFQIGQKELVYLREQIRNATEQVDTFIETLDETISKIDRKDLGQAEKIREYLVALADAQKNAPQEVNQRLFSAGTRLFGWRRAQVTGSLTAAAIIEAFKADIEKSLLYEPLSIAQKAAETVLLMTTIKQQLDMAAIMADYIADKRKSLDEFPNTFKNEQIVKYLKEGTFLDVQGGTVSDWFSQIYSVYEETDKHLQMLTRDVEKYTGAAGVADSSVRERMLWFDRRITHPQELLNKLNAELSEWNTAIEKWSEISEDVQISIPLAENEDFAKKVFTEYRLPYALEALDPTKLIQAGSEER